MSTMTKPQRARWNNRMRKAGETLEGLIAHLATTFEPCPEREPTPGEGKQEECEALAADCVREAIGCLEGAKARLAAAYDHIDWEANREMRNAQHRFTQEWLAARKKQGDPT